MSRILLFAAIVALAVMTGRATDPQPAPPTTAAVAAAHTVATPAPAPTPYTCTSPSSCAVLAAALNGPTAQPQPQPRQHRQPRAHSTQRRTQQATEEDQPGWSCATQGNHVCGAGVAGGPLADDTCPAGGVRVHGTPHGCRYR